MATSIDSLSGDPLEIILSHVGEPQNTAPVCKEWSDTQNAVNLSLFRQIQQFHMEHHACLPRVYETLSEQPNSLEAIKIFKILKKQFPALVPNVSLISHQSCSREMEIASRLRFFNQLPGGTEFINSPEYALLSREDKANLLNNVLLEVSKEHLNFQVCSWIPPEIANITTLKGITVSIDHKQNIDFLSKTPLENLERISLLHSTGKQCSREDFFLAAHILTEKHPFVHINGLIGSVDQMMTLQVHRAHIILEQIRIAKETEKNALVTTYDNLSVEERYFCIYLIARQAHFEGETPEIPPKEKQKYTMLDNWERFTFALHEVLNNQTKREALPPKLQEIINSIISSCSWEDYVSHIQICENYLAMTPALQLAVSKMIDPNPLLTDLMAHIPAFFEAVKSVQAIVDCYNTLGQEGKSTIHGKIWNAAGRPLNGDPDWGNTHRFDDLMLLVRLMKD